MNRQVAVLGSPGHTGEGQSRRTLTTRRVVMTATVISAGIQMVSHGIMTALFFSVVGMIYDRAHTRDMDELSGMRRALPWTVVAFIIGGLVSMGMPGLSGFIAEFPIFLGVWNGNSIDVNTGL